MLFSKGRCAYMRINVKTRVGKTRASSNIQKHERASHAPRTTPLIPLLCPEANPAVAARASGPLSLLGAQQVPPANSKLAVKQQQNAKVHLPTIQMRMASVFGYDIPLRVGRVLCMSL
eukprot:6175472-Pleurochrysis_carterae.AAC.2